MPDETVLVQAPNGKSYRFHGGYAKGFVYAYGHRVYGTATGANYDVATGRFVRAFQPHGKWAFILDPAPSPVSVG
jgi:hypothetical protein